VSDVTQLLRAAGQGNPRAAEDLLPLVYQELRRLAAHKMANEAPGHTLQPTALVHEAWLRLAGEDKSQWDGRAHFFAAAAEAMRRILIDRARRKQAQKRGGGMAFEELDESQFNLPAPADEMVAIDEALDALAREDATAATLVKLRYFAGLTMAEATAAMDIPVRTAERSWSYSRAWLRRAITASRE
jgi:RNA polymerase sigma factor (TIGR02999 family)